MRSRLLTLTLALVALLATAGTASAAARYYVSLGDSLAAGYQPNPAGGIGLVTKEGYSEQLLATARKKIRNLELVEYGCPGESTGTFIAGSCKGARTAAQRASQLRRAERFLERNRRKISFVPYSIGADDFLPCVTAGYVVDTFCIAAALQFAVPVATAKVCALTWMCTGHQDIHANRSGHAVLAAEFKKALRL